MRKTLPPMRFVFPILALAACGLAAPANAALTICNESANTTRVAVGRFNGTDWLSEGWWSLKSHQCQIVVPGKLLARYYYLYATDGGSGAWGGTRKFCVSEESKFQAVGRHDCAGRGLDQKGFFEVDTGQKLNFTQSISD